jgi:hypothetical protein
VFLTAAIMGWAGWMLAGWVLGASPLFLRDELDVTGTFVVGLFATVVLGSSGIAQLLLRRRPLERVLPWAAAGAVAGMAVVLGAALVGSVPAAFAGAVVSGVASGVLTMTAARLVLGAAPAQVRGGVASAYLAVAYLAVSLPVVGAGIFADHLGWPISTAVYIVVLSVTAALATRRVER